MRMPTLVFTVIVVTGLSSASIALAQTPTLTPSDALRPPAAVSAPDAASADGATFGSLFSDLGQELRRLPSKSNALTLGLGSALALATYPADRRLTKRATLSTPLDRVLESGAIAGSGWVQGGGALATFVVGRVTGNRRVQDVGTDLVQAQILSSIMTQGLKVAVGRSRPDGGRFSFPSGHASTTFANATVLQRHLGWKAGVPAYAFASYVAASRLQENRHYASDVIFGAAIGIVAGRTVTVGRGRAKFSVAPVAVRGGAGVMFARIP
jgi:membrane-associated phospholipid phosphatase